MEMEIQISMQMLEDFLSSSSGTRPLTTPSGGQKEKPTNDPQSERSEARPQDPSQGVPWQDFWKSKNLAEKLGHKKIWQA